MKVKDWACTLFLALSLLVPIPALADRATDLVFSTDVLENIPENWTAVYSHQRFGPYGDRFRPVEDGEIRLTIESSESSETGGKNGVIEVREKGMLRSRTRFPESSGNPVVMVFLEYTLRSMAGLTGGSPFYLRNRIKEALAAGGKIEPVTETVGGRSVEAVRVVFRPFLHDRNAHRMGSFVGLEISFVVSEHVPGGFVQFSAGTPEKDGKKLYQETIRFVALKDQE